jgi:hypothetical protein
MSGPGIRDVISQGVPSTTLPNQGASGGFAPAFLADGGSAAPTIGGKLLYTMGRGIDYLLEKSNQGIRARMPLLCDPTTLPYLGLDRLLSQGPLEPNASFRVRLQQAFQTWKRAGSARAIMGAIQPYLLPSTWKLRTVSDASIWYTYESGASTSSPPDLFRGSVGGTGDWNWDGHPSTYDPHPQGLNAWWRWWLIIIIDMTIAGTSISIASNTSPIVITTSTAHGLGNGQQVFITGVAGNLAANSCSTGGVAGVTKPFFNGWITANVTSNTFQILTLDGRATVGSGTSSAGGDVYAVGPQNQTGFGPGPSCGAPGVVCGDANISCGFNQPSPFFKGIQTLIAQWKAANSWCRWIVVTFNPALFSPLYASGDPRNPSGGFGPWTQIAAGNYVASRFVKARYCDGVA